MVNKRGMSNTPTTIANGVRASQERARLTFLFTSGVLEGVSKAREAKAFFDHSAVEGEGECETE